MFLLAALLPPLLYALYRAHKAHQHHGHDHDGDGHGDGAGPPGESESERAAREAAEAEQARQRDEARRAREAAELAAKTKRVEKAQEGDSRAFAQLLRKARVRSDDPNVCSKIAAAVRPEDIELAIYAGTPQMSDLDLKSRRSEEPSMWPTDDIRPEPMTDPDQLLSVVPEDMMKDDDQFWDSFALDELTILQPFSEVREQPLIAIVLDGSPSMDEGKLANGTARHILARGVAINLLLRALDGGTRYLFRYFDTHPRALEVVDTPEAAQRLMERLSDTFEQGGGTDVRAGFKQTVDDIRAKGGEWTRAEIVLISDCEDNNLTPEGLAEAVAKEDIRFHVVVVGPPNPSLKSVATSYREFV